MLPANATSSLPAAPSRHTSICICRKRPVDVAVPAPAQGLLASCPYLDHLNDLLVGETRLHWSAIWLGGLYTKLEEF